MVPQFKVYIRQAISMVIWLTLLRQSAHYNPIMVNSSKRATAFDRIHNLGWRAIRRINGAGGRPVLNADLPNHAPADPAKELFQIAQELKADAIEEDGRRVDYASLAQANCYHKLRQLTGALSACSLEDLGDRDNRLAFWINLYNALILDGIIRYQVTGRIPFSLYQRAAYDVCGHRFSADDIEHGVLRGNRPHPLYRLPPFPAHDPRLAAIIEPFDPRIHFALNCGARSCPPIAFYSGDRIDSQLGQAAVSFINGGGAEIDLDSSIIKLSQIFNWYQSDFGGQDEVLALVADHLTDQAAEAALRKGQLKVRFADYNWSVNGLV